MKTTILLCSLALGGFAMAEFETWTSSDGRSAELELKNVTEIDGEKTGEFKMRNGRSVKIAASGLTEADAKRLNEWKSPEEIAAAEAGPQSVFDEIFDGNLVRLSGKSLKKVADAPKPEKLYVFYYTASWCVPCQQFTPSLVEFYNKHKNDNFEIVLITSDSDEDAMEGYAVSKEMPWPQLKLKKAEDFKKEFKHGVTGIPSVIVCKLDGTKLGNYRDLNALEKLVNE
ncbi:thioredoxin-like domain-containing protein [Haloferula chungangensis]|uniref:Thioredoxin-like domain-containing protein n=1 Tax=Haloferula chungangensis TaxID=1048331 RepID=A0ABW2L5G8_9BACT